jgi:predicted permease
MESFRQDLHHAARMFARKPALTLVAVATLAIGIGASTAIFSVLYVTLLRPLPYPNAKRLCVVWTVLGPEAGAPASGPELLSLADRNKLFEQVGGIWVQTGALTGKSEPIQVTLGWVTSNFLSMLTPRLQVGRLFLPEEQGSGRAHVVILSYELWKTRYGLDPAILGHAVLLNGQPYTVVGILPVGFKLIFPDGAAVPPQVDVYSPFQADLAGQPRDQEYICRIATLRRGISVQSAQSELSSFAAQLRSGFHEYSEQNLHLQIVPLQQDATDAIRAPLLALFAGSGLLLLIVCSDLAILLLTRANERLTEISLRAALGAQPGRIMRQLFTESILLSCLGGCAGVVFFTRHPENSADIAAVGYCTQYLDCCQPHGFVLRRVDLGRLRHSVRPVACTDGARGKPGPASPPEHQIVNGSETQFQTNPDRRRSRTNLCASHLLDSARENLPRCPASQPWL